MLVLFFHFQEQSLIQLHKEHLQSMHKSHLESRIDVQYEQLKALHKMRTEHLNKQHALEWDNVILETKKAEKELKKKHAMELKQYPKSLRVSLHQDCVTLLAFLSYTDQRSTDQEAISKHCQDSTEAVQIYAEGFIGYSAQGETQRCSATV